MIRILLILIMAGIASVHTGTAATPHYDFIVAVDGSGDFVSLQDAFDAVPDFRKNVTRIFVKKGIYKEKLILASSKNNVWIFGEHRDSVLLTYDDYASKLNRFGEEMGTTGSSSFFVFGDGFRAEGITFENSSGPVGQAVAVRITGNQASFFNCRFMGFQDTLYPQGENSHQYYHNCHIEGTVDFIFGWSTAVFDHCTIVCKEKGYITAPSTKPGVPHGFVFIDCTITGDAGEGSFYLGRPWRDYGRAVFIRCEMGSMIRPEGWHNWNKPQAEKTAFFAEYNSRGPGARGPRVAWAHQLSDSEAAEYTPEKILGDWINNVIKTR